MGYPIVSEIEIAGLEEAILQSEPLLSCTDIRRLVVETVKSKISESESSLQHFPPIPMARNHSDSSSQPLSSSHTSDGHTNTGNSTHINVSTASFISSALDALPPVVHSSSSTSTSTSTTLPPATYTAHCPPSNEHNCNHIMNGYPVPNVPTSTPTPSASGVHVAYPDYSISFQPQQYHTEAPSPQTRMAIPPSTQVPMINSGYGPSHSSRCSRSCNNACYQQLTVSSRVDYNAPYSLHSQHANLNPTHQFQGHSYHDGDPTQQFTLNHNVPERQLAVSQQPSVPSNTHNSIPVYRYHPFLNHGTNARPQQGTITNAFA